MCSAHETAPRRSSTEQKDRRPDHGTDGPPDWETMELPPSHILKRLTDAHCHPTDTSDDPSHANYMACGLGVLATMATIPEDQSRVNRLSRSRGARIARKDSTQEKPMAQGIGDDDEERQADGEQARGPKTIACFGYHPWFTHRYTLIEPPPSREEHYFSLFLPGQPLPGPSSTFASASSSSSSSAAPTDPSSMPSTANVQLLSTLLPYLPDPIPFSRLLHDLRANIRRAKSEGRAVMLGEVGLDGSARMRWPVAARHLYTEKYPSNVPGHETHADQDEDEWRRLTPFKVPMKHQREVLELQMGIAVDEGVNVSLHSVAAAGPTMDTFLGVRKQWGHRFTHGINVDIHSGGGWRPDFWQQAERTFPNLYASPSILITGRSTTAPALIRAISKDRLLVESDTHDVQYTTRLVWGAAEWVARVRGWKLEGRDGLPEEVRQGSLKGGEGLEKGDEVSERPGGYVAGRTDVELEGSEGEVWTVQTLEANWKEFMRMRVT